MLRLVYRQDLTAEGTTDTEAERAAASLETVAGLAILSERTVAHPRETIAALGATVAEARTEVQRLSPAGAQVIAEKVLSEPARWEMVVDAADEASAVARAKERSGPFPTASVRRSADDEPTEVSLVEVQSATMREAGQRGFLGFGAKLPRYDVVMIRKACVERTIFRGWKFIRTVGVEVRSVEPIQRCARSDNLTRERDFEIGTSELAAEGAIGSLGLAKLIDACRESCSAAILWPLRAAREAQPTRALIDALETALRSEPSARVEGQTWLSPELVGDGRIGWSDRTFHQLKSLARESLDALAQRQARQEQEAPPEGSIMIVCAHCNTPAAHRIDDELLCSAHYQQR